MILKTLRCTFSILMLSFASYSNATVSFPINFGTDSQYVTSMNNIREGLGTPMQNIHQGNTFAYMLRSTNSGPVIFQPVGVSYYEDEEVSPVQLVIDSNNLYVAGFLVSRTNTFYRFSDMSHLSLSDVTTVNLTNESSYTALERVASLDRVGMQVNRQNLVDADNALANFTGNSLTQSAARGLLRYITVTAEALRFRQIQREFRPALSATPSEFTFSDSDRTLTQNWGALSEASVSFSDTTTGIITTGVRLSGLREVLSALALLQYCPPNVQMTIEKVNFKNNNQTCSGSNNKVINNIVWTRSALIAANIY